MIHVYKNGGEHERDGIMFSIKCISKSEKFDYISNGWASDFSELRGDVTAYDEYSELTAILEAAGQNPRSDCKIETLRKKVEELERVRDSE